MAELNFDASQVAPDSGSFAIPADWYNVMIDQSEIKPTKDGLGAYLELRFSVIDGQYANSKIFSRLNIKNASPVAQEIAFAQLSAVAHSVGVLQVKNSELLHGIPLKIKVSYKPAVNNEDGSEKYGAGNDIKAFKNINEAIPGGTGAATPADAGTPQGFGMQQPAQPIQQPMQQAMQQPQQVMPAQEQPMQQPAQAQAQAQQTWQQPAQQPWPQPAQEQAQMQPQTAQVQPVQEQPAQPMQQVQQPMQQPAQQASTNEAPPWNPNEAPAGNQTAPWNKQP